MVNPNNAFFLYCPSCGQKSLEPACHKSFICTSCSFKFYINTAGAVIALIFNKKGQLLVTVRKNDPFQGFFDLPGGFIEPGETLEEGLVREVKEELNLEVNSLEYLRSLPNRYPFRKVEYPIIDTVFQCRVTDFSTIEPRDDVADYSFINIEKLDVHRFGLDSVKRLIQMLIDHPL